MALISIVVAMDENGLIGANHALPWRLPDDMKWFKQVTMGKPVLMGRKTYESIPIKFRPLSGRHNIILTRDTAYMAPGCTIVHTITDGLQKAGAVEEIIIGGGAELYTQTLPLANRIYLTRIHHTFPGDTYFPSFNQQTWQETWVEFHPADANHPFPFHWYILNKPGS